MMNVQAGPSTYNGIHNTASKTKPLPKGPTKRLCLSERILFAKARLNRVSQKKKLFHPAEDRFAEQTDLDEDEQLLEAAKSGKDSKVKRLIINGCSNKYVDEDGRSALHWAAEYGYIKIVYVLLESGWNVDLLDRKKQSPLHVACDHHNGNIAACFISQGCKINNRDINGNTPLHRAIHTNLEIIACMLCNLGADVNAKNKSEWTPLHEAARVGNEYVAQKLIKFGADVNAISSCNSTPFLTTVFYYRIAHKSSYGSLEPMLRLLIDSGCQLSFSDGQWTPLLSAIAVYNSKIASKLIYNGCLIERQKLYGKSLLVDAFTKCDHYVVKLLVMAGYQVTPDELEQCQRRIPTFSLSFLRLAFPGYEVGRGGRCIEILRFLDKHAHNPFSLQALCKTSIRVGLNRASGDSSIVDRIPSLPLPRKLKDEISFKDFAIRHLQYL